MSLENPTSEAELIQHCLLRLQMDAEDVDVTEFQCKIRVKEALKYFHDYHTNATEHEFIAHQLTQTDIDNGYIITPDYVHGVTRVFSTDNMSSVSSMMTGVNSPDWAIAGTPFGLNGFTGAGNVMMNVFLVKNFISNFQGIMTAEDTFHWNPHTKKLHTDANWSRKLKEGKYLLYEAYLTLIGQGNTEFWGNDFLIRYTTALFKFQWGENLSKFQNIPMPSGYTFNGSDIKSAAEQEIKDLREEAFNTWSLHPALFVG